MATKSSTDNSIKTKKKNKTSGNKTQPVRYYEVEKDLKKLVTGEDHSDFSFAQLFQPKTSVVQGHDQEHEEHEGEEHGRQEREPEEGGEERQTEHRQHRLTNFEDKPLSRFESFRQGVDYRKPNEVDFEQKYAEPEVNVHSTEVQQQKLTEFIQSQATLSVFFFNEQDPRFRSSDQFGDPTIAERHANEWNKRSQELIKVILIFFLEFFFDFTTRD